ncbi:MAG: MBL fold metallo-hydrolase [Candidatus Coproplasma sp.]
MLVTILGSCANQISNREGVAILVESKNDNLLIDCGPGVVAAFGRACRKASDVNNVLLTHVHGDHTSGFAYFVWNRNFERMGAEPAKDLHVYGAKETLELAEYSLKHSYPELNFPFKVIYHIISGERKEEFNLGEIKVKTSPANHAVPCVSCCVECGDKKVVYSCDTLPNDNLLEHNNPDLLIHEGMMINAMAPLSAKVKHSMASHAGEFATKVNAKHLALVHIAPVLLGKESVLLNEAAEKFSGMISVPFDGTVYRV